ARRPSSTRHRTTGTTTEPARLRQRRQIVASRTRGSAEPRQYRLSLSRLPARERASWSSGQRGAVNDSGPHGTLSEYGRASAPATTGERMNLGLGPTSTHDGPGPDY